MADAPKLRAYWRKDKKQRLVGTMPRAAAGNLRSRQDDSVVQFDIWGTPIAGVLSGSVVLGAVARRIDEATLRVAVFRDDPQDVPEHVNQDQYDICLNLVAHPGFARMVAGASTCANDNMNAFSRENVFFTKRRTGDGFCHRMKELPSSVAAVMRSTGG